MKKLPLYISLIILMTVLSANPANAIKCGNDMIQVGDTTWEVRSALTNNGGKIIGKENAGTKSTSGYYTPDGGRDYISNAEKVEKWLISVPGGEGVPSCYELTFVGSILKKIGSGAECK